MQKCRHIFDSTIIGISDQLRIWLDHNPTYRVVSTCIGYEAARNIWEMIVVYEEKE